MKKLLVTGISGFLGWHVTMHEQSDWDIVGLYHENKIEKNNITTKHCDLNADFSTFSTLISEIQPDAILHLAACSNPNDCELSPLEAKKINIETTSNLVKYCKEHNIYFLFTSTDLVFDGKSTLYEENSATSPINIYGKQKVKIEELISDLSMNAAIARLPLMYGLDSPINPIIKEWLKKIKEGGTVYAFSDEYRSMVSGASAVSGLFLLLNNEVNGIWHLGGRERISRYGFLKKVSYIFGLPISSVIKSKQYDLELNEYQANRPADVSLKSSKAYSIGYNPLSVNESLKIMYSRLNNQSL